MQTVVIAIGQMFLLVGLGFVLSRFTIPLIGSFESNFWKGLSTFIYRVALPPLIFFFISGIVWNQEMIGFALTTVMAIGAVILALVICTFVLPLDTSARRLVAGISHQANSVYIGFPILLAMMGPSVIGKAAFAAVISAMISTVVAVAILGHGSEAVHPIARVFHKWRRDPFILSCVFGIIWSVFSLPRPDAIMKPLKMIGDLAPTLSMIVVGANLRFVPGHIPVVGVL
ncbi:MAG: AEC family transporter, partial [Patescibacteria group bacterium]